MKALKYLMGKIADNLVGVILTAVGGALLVLFAPVWEYLKAIWEWFTAPVQVSRVFVILPVSMLVLVAVWLLRSLIIKRRAPKPPAWLSYREDEFEGAIWRWDYDSNGQIEHLIPYCKSCDCILELRTFGLGNPVEMYCVDCNYSYSAFSMNVSPEYAHSIIIRLIDRNLRRNYNRLKAEK
ncbi:hypothetical protein [Pseudomonas sp. Marseille-Q7302]